MDKQTPEEFVHALFVAYPVNPFNPREIVIGCAAVEIKPFGGMVWLSGIRVTPAEQHKGAASTALQALLRRADAAGVTIGLHPQPFTVGTGLGRRELIQWYMRHGFAQAEVDWQQDRMVRQPKVSITSPDI